MMRVSELMTPSPVQVSEDAPIATCALRMEHLGVRHLPVVAGDGRLAGLITDAAVRRHGAIWGGEFVPYDANAALTARDLASVAEVVAGEEDDLSTVVRRLAKTRQDCVVVVDPLGHPTGVLTEHDLLKVALLVVPETLTVARLPPRRVITYPHTELASVALEAMARHEIRHLPVTGADGAVVGLVSWRDLVAADAPRRAVTLDELRVWEVFTSSLEDPLVKCAARMLELRVGCLPVIERGRAVRMVTRRDLVEAAAAGLEDEGLFGADGGAPSPDRG